MAAIGRWGEELVYRQLIHEYASPALAASAAGSSGASGSGSASAARGGGAWTRVVWVNRDAESGLPYDLYLQHPDDSVTYIEVGADKRQAKQAAT